jgi:hypothetical protein
MADLERDPCPYRIYEDAGSGFLLGCLGGAVFHLAKGWRNSPKLARTSGALTAARLRAPILGGNFAVWGGLFSSFDCALAHGRGSCSYLANRVDKWNPSCMHLVLLRRDRGCVERHPCRWYYWWPPCNSRRCAGVPILLRSLSLFMLLCQIV